jgi:Flp pilus assembly protein TadD
LLARIPDWLAGAAPTDKADLLALRGALDTAQGPRWFAQAAATLWLGLSGEPGRDRGHWVGLASLYERAGDASGALAVLDSAVEHYPNEFTFHHARARTLLRATRASEAVAAARAALQHGFGDNRLRAANTLALALDAAGDRPAALALVEATLLEATRPADGTDVRTFRYLSALEATQALLRDRPPEAP